MQKTGTPNEYRRELKKKILAYAMNQFVVNGIRAVRMDVMAKTLGISKRTVYEIYKDKEELLIDGLTAQYEIAERRMKDYASKSDNVIELLANFYRVHMLESAKVNPVFLVDVEKYPKALQFIKKQSEERDKKAALFFKKGVEEGYFRDDIDYNIITEVGKYTSQAIMSQQLFKKYSMVKLFRNMMLVNIRGFCTVKGVQLLDELMK